MPVRTKRWNDPRSADDGFRILICRYRPRGVSKADETWDAFCPALGPSKALHAAVYGKTEAAIDFAEYTRRFVIEMERAAFWISGFAKRVQAGDTITLLCSSACVDETRCHRLLVRRLIEQAASPAQQVGPVRRRS